MDRPPLRLRAGAGFHLDNLTLNSSLQLRREAEEMARRSGIGTLIAAMAREAARQQRLAEAAQRRSARDRERFAREQERANIAANNTYARTTRELERLEKLTYVENREAEAAELSSDMNRVLKELNGILPHTLTVNDAINFDSLRIKDELPSFTPPIELTVGSPRPTPESFRKHIESPSGLRSLLPGSSRKFRDRLAEADRAYRESVADWETREAARKTALSEARMEFDMRVAALETKRAQRNAEVDEFESGYRVGDPDTIVAYTSMVLERSAYPEFFPRNVSVAYMADSRQLVVESELPDVTAIPAVDEYRYIKARDEITSKLKKEAEIKRLYQDVISSIALRTIHEVFESDLQHHIDVCCFNGYVATVDPATGRDIQPHLISVRTTKDRFEAIDLARVDKPVCLRNLGAQVSRHPTEAQPVKPIIEFDMADARFVDQNDLVSALDSAVNLMELTPTEFEHLVANLFGQMGLESKLTRTSRDGGVDCVAYDSRPVLGGKVVIQAKRYRHTVGVSAVRDLYGTMLNEGANKGILVATSGYGPDAFEFARDKPIELIEGGGLLFLLREVGVEARIVMPEGA